jgi:FkbM family methyltransferase
VPAQGRKFFLTLQCTVFGARDLSMVAARRNPLQCRTTMNRQVLEEQLKITKTQTRYGDMLVPAADTYVGRSLIEYGEWTQSEINLLTQLVRPGMAIADIGANVGYHTLALAKAVGNGQVIAIEPQPGIFQLLCANIANNELGNVAALNMAIDEQRDQLDMPPLSYDEPQNYGSLDIRPYIKPEQVAPQYISVPVQRLDDIVMARNVNLIKLDVEGMELAVLRGAENILKKNRPALFVNNETPGESSDKLLRYLMEETAYDCYWQAAYCFRPNNFKQNQTNVFFNVCCINVLAIPREANSSIRGLPKVADASEHPRKWTVEHFKTEFPGT